MSVKEVHAKYYKELLEQMKILYEKIVIGKGKGRRYG